MDVFWDFCTRIRAGNFHTVCQLGHSFQHNETPAHAFCMDWAALFSCRGLATVLQLGGLTNPSSKLSHCHTPLTTDAKALFFFFFFSFFFLYKNKTKIRSICLQFTKLSLIREKVTCKYRQHLT